MVKQDTQRLTEVQIHSPEVTETALAPDGSAVVYGVREPLMDDQSRYLVHL